MNQLARDKGLDDVTTTIANETSVTFDPSISYEEEIEIYEIPPFLTGCLTVIYMLVSACAVLGNWMVLWIVIKSKNMRSVTNLFISNIAISDISIGALAIPFQFQAALLQKWLLPHFLCSFCPTVQIVSLNVSIFTLVALSYDRHRAITSPLKPRLSRTTAYMINGCIWLISLSLSIPTFLAYQIEWVQMESEKPHGDNSHIEWIPRCGSTALPQSFLRPYNHTLVVLQYVIPFVAISFFYCHMALVLRSNLRISGDSRQGSSRSVKSKKRVIKMLLIVISVFALCWLPFQAYNILQEIFPKINNYRYINLIWFSCHLLAMSNSCINPFIYAIYGEKFNYEFTQRFSCCCYWASRFTPSVKNSRVARVNILNEKSAEKLLKTEKRNANLREASTSYSPNSSNEAKLSTGI